MSRIDLSSLDIPTFDVNAKPQACPKGKTRLQITEERRPLTTVTEKQFKGEVWKRDKNHCRCCGRKVEKLLGRVAKRGEVNHLHGRTGDLRFEVRAACLLCLKCHERYTGRVGGDKLLIVATQTFTIRQGTFTDATFPISFVKAGA